MEEEEGILILDDPFGEDEEDWSNLVNQSVDNSKQEEYYPEIDDPTTDFDKSMHSIGTIDQGNFDSCGVWALSDAITRVFSVYYNFISPDKRHIVWKENDINNCKRYNRQTPSYKYCIIYNFFQLFIRKKAGTCGIKHDKMLEMIQLINHDFLGNQHDMNSNIKSLGSESETHLKRFRKERHQTHTRMKKFTNEDTDFQRFVKQNKTQSSRNTNKSNKLNELRNDPQEKLQNTKSQSQVEAHEIYKQYKKLSLRKSEFEATANDSHLQDLSSIFKILINQHIILKTTNVNDNLRSAIQLINKNGYYGVINIWYQYSWGVLFAQLSKNVDINRDIFENLRNSNNVPIDQESPGHIMVVKRIRYNGTEYEYLIKNSWGAGWGYNGEMWIPKSCLPVNFKIDVIYLDRGPEAAAAAASHDGFHFGGKIKSKKTKKSMKKHKKTMKKYKKSKTKKRRK
jgi:hypothetical protein